MADWNLPTLSSPYGDVPTLLKDLSLDAATLFVDEPTNPVEGMIKLVRSPVKFQERSTTNWTDVVLDLTGGGTGATTAAAARTNLGLGSMALQESSAVAISGGTLAGDGAGLIGLNASNLATGTVPQARKWTEATLTLTGNQDNVSFSNADFVRLNNASLLTVRGLAAGVAGQRVTLVSVGAGQVELAHQNANSSSSNRLVNFATSATTPLGAGVGAATYEYDSVTARWRLTAHNQGAWITPAFSAGDYTASGSMTWTVDAGDIVSCQYWLNGRALTVTLSLNTSSVGGTLSNELRRTIPGGFSAAHVVFVPVFVTDNATNRTGLVTLSGSTLKLLSDYAASNWSASTNSTSVNLSLTFQVN